MLCILADSFTPFKFNIVKKEIKTVIIIPINKKLYSILNIKMHQFTLYAEEIFNLSIEKKKKKKKLYVLWPRTHTNQRKKCFLLAGCYCIEMIDISYLTMMNQNISIVSVRLFSSRRLH